MKTVNTGIISAVKCSPASLVADETRTKVATKCATDFFGTRKSAWRECCNLLIYRGLGLVGVTGFEPVTSCM